MSHNKIWVLADPHLQHDKVAHARGFDSVEDHDRTIYRNLKSLVNPRKDTLIILGDVAFGDAKNAQYLSAFFKAKIIRCVMGNHDKPSYMPSNWQLVGSHQHDQETILTHIPVHPFSLEPQGRWARNIHGHFHEDDIIEHMDERYRCVSLEMTHMEPILLSDVFPAEEPEPEEQPADEPEPPPEPMRA